MEISAQKPKNLQTGCLPVMQADQSRPLLLLVLYHHGGMITDGVMLRLAEDKFWMAQADGELMKWYLAHAHDFDVTISDPNVKLLRFRDLDQ